MKQSKITFLTSIGAGLEYYDFVIYTLLATYISKQFFPASNHTAALFNVFIVFALSNIIRPIGGMLLGILGDRFGRKNIFANTLLWMSIATVIMGITPTFTSIGIAATIIFSLCRILQGITCGAEIPGAATFLLEHIATKRRGLHFGFMVSSIGLGVTFGSLIVWILTKTLSDTQILSWGFRIPFLLGGTLALVGFIIRKYIPETPEFLAIKNPNIKTILTSLNTISLKQVLNTIGILLFPACFVTFFLVLPVYLPAVYHYSLADVALATTVGYLWSTFLLPIFGWLSDYIGRKQLLFISALLFLICSQPIFSLLQLETSWALWIFVIFGQTIIAALAACYFILLPQSFPATIRYTGTAFSYNIAYTIAALIPVIANYIYNVLKKPVYITVLFILLALITAISTVMHRTTD